MTQMKSIVIVVFPYISHYYPMFEYARHWKEKGYRIIFTGNSREIEYLISRENFEYCDFTYMDQYTIKNAKIFFGLLIRSIADTSFYKTRYRQFHSMQMQIDYIQKKYNVEKFFFDEHLSYLYFFFRDNKENVLCINTKLSTTKRKGIPPLNSSLVATNKFLNIIQCELLWFLHLGKLKFQDFKNFVVFLGKDDTFFLKRIAKKNNLNYKENISENHMCYKGVKNVNTILIAPQTIEYDFSPIPKNESYFLEKLSRNEEQLKSVEYKLLIEFITQQKKNPRTKIICCSFGTFSTKAYNLLHTFINDVVCRLNDSNLIFVITPNYLMNKENIQENIKSFNYLPLLDFIPYIDLMITHGGLGTIKECLQNNKKMIIYPLQKMTSDQPGNGARIRNKRLGLSGNLEKENTEKLLIKINQLLDRNH